MAWGYYTNVTYNRHRLLIEVDALIDQTPRIRLEDVARTLGVDRHTIENAMRSRRQTTFREYRRKRLMEAAQSMMDRPDCSIKEIGIKLGYSSAASFSRFIRQTTGKSPSQLRN